MRGKHGLHKAKDGYLGITPAHAGKTATIAIRVRESRDHPRACGENVVCNMDVDQVPGLPRVCEENCAGTASKARKMKGGKSCETEKSKKR